ncbi:MAG: LamG-like jellyroll fold domain-containing protein [Spirochaetota bacterium]
MGEYPSPTATLSSFWGDFSLTDLNVTIQNDGSNYISQLIGISYTGTSPSFTYSSDNVAVVIVHSGDGMLLPIGPGSTTVHVTCGSYTHSFIVTVPALPPVAVWLLDGNYGDTSANGNTLASTGSPTFVSGHRPGIQAAKFDGSTQYVSSVLAPGFNVNYYSISFWFNATSLPATGIMGNFFECNNGSSVLAGAIDSAGTVRIIHYSGSGNPHNVSSTAYGTGSWHHVVATYDGTTMNLIIDNSSTKSMAATGNDGVSSISLGAGAVYHQNYFNGAMDSFRIYNRILTGAEITALYGEGGYSGGATRNVGWARATNEYTGENTWFLGMAVDQTTGNLWRTGLHAGSFGQHSLVKTDPNGAAPSIVSGSYTNGAGSWLSGIAIDSTSNVYFAGGGSGIGTFAVGTKSIVTPYGACPNLVIGQLDSTGACVWLKTLSSAPYGTEFGPLALDGSGGLFVVGSEPTWSGQSYDYGGTATNTPPAITSGNHNFAVVKYSTAGVGQWARTPINATNWSYCYGIAANGTGAWAVGQVMGPDAFNFGGSSSSISGSSNGSNLVIVKYDSSGSAQWATTTSAGSGGGASQYNAVAVDASGNAYAAGFTTGTTIVNLGNGKSVTPASSSSTATTDTSLVLVKYDSTGTPLWATTVESGTGSSIINSLAIEPNGNIFVGGSIAGSGVFNLGNGVTVQGSASAGNNLFVAEYNSGGSSLWARSTSSGNVASQVTSVAVGSSGQLYATGYMDLAGTLGVSGSISVTGPSSAQNAILLEYQ